MKSTYQLFGQFWDQRPIDGTPSFISEMPWSVTPIGGEPTLFDPAQTHWVLPASKMFSMESDEMENLITPLKGLCNHLYLCINYLPATTSHTVWRFFMKRLCQAYCYLKETLSNTLIDVVVPDKQDVFGHPARIQSLFDLFLLVDSYYRFLETRSVHFSKSGFPLIEADSCLLDIPSQVVPYRERKGRLVEDPDKTALCFYSRDSEIYTRLARVFDDIDEYKDFMAIIGPDLTVTPDMDDEWQAFIMLINQLMTAVLAVNGVKVIPNIRCGSAESVQHLLTLPKNVICATGTLGCPVSNEWDLTFAQKVLLLGVNHLIIYGRRDSTIEDQLNVFNIGSTLFRDSHQQHKAYK